MTNTTEANTDAKQGTKRPRKMAREPNQQALPARQTKTDLVLDLLRRPEGATINQLVAATSWLPHTTRAALTGLKKKGHVVTSEKIEGARRYRVGGGAA